MSLAQAELFLACRSARSHVTHSAREEDKKTEVLLAGKSAKYRSSQQVFPSSRRPANRATGVTGEEAQAALLSYTGLFLSTSRGRSGRAAVSATATDAPPPPPSPQPSLLHPHAP